ncbi:hypothetical protein RDI58_030351 [Solanum bulbocastanum]|uniref:Uncharacterized protein n=1 Tax=Solanum bulbocastanum TaxID=147425 RepID=A0AAN8XYS3_SOLBU
MARGRKPLLPTKAPKLVRARVPQQATPTLPPKLDFTKLINKARARRSPFLAEPYRILLVMDFFLNLAWFRQGGAADQQSSKRAEKLLSSRLPALIFEEVALDTRDIQERPALDPQVSMVVLFNISFYSSNVMLSVTSYYPPLRILCNIKERESSYYRGGRSSPNTFPL